MSTTRKKWSICTQLTIKQILFGQLISFCIGGTGLFSSLLEKRGFDAPALQSCPNYILLSMFLPYLFIKRGGFTLEGCWWKYAILALFDVEANFVVVKAYQYTKVTSILLLDCFSVPVCMFLSYIFLTAKYTRYHFIGCILCFSGIGALFYSDVSTTNSSTARNPLLGNLLCLLGASLYATSNVGQESVVKVHNPLEFLGMLGLFGSIISISQSFILCETSEFTLDLHTVCYMTGFVICLCSMYCMTAFMLRLSDSAFFNISLLTSNLWAVIVRIVIDHVFPNHFYILAAFLIIIGICSYSKDKVVSRLSEKQKNRNSEDVIDKDVDSWENKETTMNECSLPFVTSVEVGQSEM
eukprot:GSMAST32.ASY1.ANO1.828.1 assembled CDS